MQLSRQDILDQINTLLGDNTSRDITPQRLRDVFGSVLDNYVHKDEVRTGTGATSIELVTTQEIFPNVIDYLAGSTVVWFNTSESYELSINLNNVSKVNGAVTEQPITISINPQCAATMHILPNREVLIYKHNSINN
jgi:hypothetical protein